VLPHKTEPILYLLHLLHLVAVKAAVVFLLPVAMAAQVVADIHHRARAVQDRKAVMGVMAQASLWVAAVAAETVMALRVAQGVRGVLGVNPQLRLLITQVVARGVTQTYHSLGVSEVVVTPVLRLLQLKVPMV
jgi:hypothetical protein